MGEYSINQAVAGTPRWLDYAPHMTLVNVGRVGQQDADIALNE